MPKGIQVRSDTSLSARYIMLRIHHYALLFAYISYTSASAAHDIYMCSWPTNEVAQLRCDYSNCPHISIDEIVVGRLEGSIGDCTALNANKSTRIPIRSCLYQLTESSENKEFLVQVKANCTDKEICEVHTRSNWLFQNAGHCGHEVNNVFPIRNWVHIQYSCNGDIPDIICLPKKTTTTTTTAKPSGSASDNGRTWPPKQKDITPDNSSNHVVTMIIPILGTLLFLTLLMIVATILYRHRVCQKKSWKEAVQGQRKQSKHSKNVSSNSNLTKEDLSQFKLDTLKLKELERRLQQEHPKASNDYLQDLAFTNTIRSMGNVEQKPNCKKNRRSSSSMDQINVSGNINTDLQYYSDSSVSTTTLEECDFDSNGRKKRRHTPFPPLPKPVIRHSEVYFTETETESEAPNHKRKEALPRFQAPPREKRNEKQKPKAASMNDVSNNRNSLDLALTKLAAKKLNAHEQRAKANSKKPTAKPRNQRPASATYGNIESTHTYPIAYPDQGHSRRTNTIHADNNVYRNVF